MTPFRLKRHFSTQSMPGFIIGLEKISAKMSSSVKILDVPKKFQFSSFFAPGCVYFQKITLARNAIFFHSSAEFSNCDQIHLFQSAIVGLNFEKG